MDAGDSDIGGAKSKILDKLFIQNTDLALFYLHR